MGDQTPVFCTIFDKNYLVQALALHQSLKTHANKFKLYCLALDDLSTAALRTLAHPEIVVVTLADIDQSQLPHIRAQMSWAQLCWSMQPLFCLHILDLGESHVTYLETDSMFFSDPLVLLKEIGNRSVSLVPHHFSAEFKKFESESGRFCVQFNFFRNDANARSCLNYWLNRCLEYRKDLPFTLPGQLCLNDWEKMFLGVAVIENQGAGVAPWNIQQYRITKVKEQVYVDKTPVVFFHYHQFSRYQNGDFELGLYPISVGAYEYFYKPYIQMLLDIEDELKKKANGFSFRREIENPPNIFSAMARSIIEMNFSALDKSTQPIRRKLKGTYNVVPLSRYKQFQM